MDIKTGEVLLKPALMTGIIRVYRSPIGYWLMQISNEAF